MKPNKRFFKKACCWVLVIEAALVGLCWAAFQNSVFAFNFFPLVLLAQLLNLPGCILSRCLGLFGPGGFNPPPDPHPVAGFITTFVVGTLFWILVFWNVAGRPIPGRVAGAEGQAGTEPM